MVGGSTRGGDRNVTGGDRKTYERGYGFRRRGDRWLADRWNPLGGFSGGTGGAVGLNNGDPVSLWKDSSTGGHDASQTGTARPTFKTNILNGKPVVRFTSAGLSKLNLATPVSSNWPWTAFAVMKAATPTSPVRALANFSGFSPISAGYHVDGTAIFFDRANTFNTLPGVSSAFHVLTFRAIASGNAQPSIDGTDTGGFWFTGGSTLDFSNIGVDYTPTYSDGDIAEIIVYSGAVSIRAKLLVVLTVLISTGEIPSPDEANAMLAAGDLVALEAYLIEHGIPVEQARDTLEPMAVGDRANIEKYLGTKYGITVAGGTAVDPSTVAGLAGWWKADSLG